MGFLVLALVFALCRLSRFRARVLRGLCDLLVSDSAHQGTCHMGRKHLTNTKISSVRTTTHISKSSDQLFSGRFISDNFLLRLKQMRKFCLNSPPPVSTLIFLCHLTIGPSVSRRQIGRAESVAVLAAAAVAVAVLLPPEGGAQSRVSEVCI